MVFVPNDYGADLVEQPGFDGQLALIRSEMSVKKKMLIAGTVVISLFVAGMGLGAAAGFFIF